LSLAELAWEQGEVEAAAAYLVQSERLGEQAGAPQWPSRYHVHRARLALAGGDFNEAHRLLDEAEAHFIQGTPLPVTHPFPARRAHVWLAQERLEATAAWAAEQGVAFDDDLSYLREFEHLTLTRLLIAQGRTASDPALLTQAQSLLTRLLDAAQADGRWGSVLEIWLLQALAYAADDEIDAALDALAQALGRAEPEGYVRLFVDQGAPMAALLRAASERGIASDYVARLLDYFTSPEKRPQTPSTSVLIEPLSDRESDVLRMLATELSGPEIARELVISLNTLRTHTKNIYGKLDVNSRRAAVNRAKEFGLL
jgi:LuxR family maltose regulon positive regulatory protein